MYGEIMTNGNGTISNGNNGSGASYTQHHIGRGVLGAAGGGIAGFLGGFLTGGLFAAAGVTAFSGLPVAAIPAVFTLAGTIGGYVGAAYNLI